MMQFQYDHLHLVFEYDETLGFYQWEKHRKQKLIITIDIEVNTKKAAKSDHLKDTIDYDVVDGLIQKILKKQHYHLIETIAERTAETLLKQWPKTRVRVMVDKPFAIAHAKKISVVVFRGNFSSQWT